MRKTRLFVMSVLLPASAILALRSAASAQGLSDLYTQAQEQVPIITRPDPLIAAPGMQTDQRRLSPSLAAFSHTAVRRPAPRTYTLQDLVTIVIREDLSAGFEAEIEAEKESEWKGGIRDFPRIKLSDLIDTQINGSDVDPDITLDVSNERSFEGEGSYERKESMSARLTARIIDVKPNGTIVLEARKHLQSDDETVTLVVTGTCRVDDITLDNTVLSSQLYDLHVSKDHQGELRKSTKKGPLTKLMDTIFAF
jgi:flagellar L-ring protein precursor FlgH